MSFALDPELAQALGELMGGQPPPPPAPIGDVNARRQAFGGLLEVIAAKAPSVPNVKSEDFHTTADDGHQLTLRWYTNTTAPASGPAILYLHGGGMIALTIANYDATLKLLVAATGIPVLAVEYRLAPEVRAPIPVTDSYAGLVYLHTHAAELGVDRARIGVMGDSAGGGIAASLTHYVKLRGGPAIARQLLVYPMLDDRTAAGGDDPHVAPFALWNHADNLTGWGALLGAERVGAEDVPPTEAAGRMTVEDARALPPAYIDVGELDLFRDEDLEYARKLGKAGVSCELHLVPGASHAFDGYAPLSAVTKYVQERRIAFLKKL